MRVHILEKIYHHTNSFTLSLLFWSKGENHGIRELATAMPYGCSDGVTNIGNLSSPSCSEVNVMDLFARRKGSHGHMHYHRPKLNGDITTCSNKFRTMLSYMREPLGLHHIRTSLFSLPLSD